MNDEIKINISNGSISFINNGIGFSQFGVAREILDLITNLQEENERLKELYNEEIHKRIKAHKYIFKNMICDALYPASKVDGENVINILNKGDYK